MKKILLLCVHSVIILGNSYQAHLSDAWYPSNAKVLREKMNVLQSQAQAKYSCAIPANSIKALLVPHAGYNYSGVVASSAYQLIQSNYFKRVIIIGPSHHESFTGVALPSQMYQRYKNSLGYIAFDTKMLSALRKDASKLFHDNDEVYQHEHAIEVQIPFIQKYCVECKIVPLLIGDLDQEQLQQVAEVLRPFLDSSTLLVATSDLVHYGDFFNYTPFENNIMPQILSLDNRCINSIETFDVDAFRSIIASTKATVCGAKVIELLLMLFGHQSSAVYSYVTAYDRSSKQDKKVQHSVGYVGIVFSNVAHELLPLQDQLTGYEKQVLRCLAQKKLQTLFSTAQSECSCDEIITMPLRQNRGAFVTLYEKNKQLRGCIGTVISQQPLYATVCEMTKSAALHDTRFTPVKQSEINDLTIAISVLTQPRSVPSYHDIKLGTDGVILKYQDVSALFLPHVATDFGWDIATMLAQLSQKAGLASDAWKSKQTQFEIFQAIDV